MRSGRADFGEPNAPASPRLAFIASLLDTRLLQPLLRRAGRGGCARTDEQRPPALCSQRPLVARVQRDESRPCALDATAARTQAMLQSFASAVARPVGYVSVRHGFLSASAPVTAKDIPGTETAPKRSTRRPVDRFPNARTWPSLFFSPLPVRGLPFAGTGPMPTGLWLRYMTRQRLVVCDVYAVRD